MPRRHFVRLIIALCLMLGAGAALFGAAGPAAVQTAQAQSAPYQVFGLRGMVQPVTGQTYASTLTEPNGVQYGIVGVSPQVEAEIAQFAARSATVRVWGTVRPPGPLGPTPVIIATDLIEEAPPTPTPTPSPAPSATISVHSAYVRTGPGQDFVPVGVVTQGTVCAVVGRSAAGGWWQLQCPGVTGWVMEGLYTIAGDTNGVPVVAAPGDVSASPTVPPTPPLLAAATPLAPTPTPPPAPSFAPQAVSDWVVLGFANRDLAGNPSVSLAVQTLDFNWGTAAPHPSLPADEFSLRAERTVNFAPGSYVIAATYDDGIRVFVNNVPAIDDWNEGAVRSTSWQGTLSGLTQLRVEYFEAFSEAQVRVSYAAPAPPTPSPALPPTPPAPPSGRPPSGAWLATYFNNIQLAEPAAITRVEPRSDVFPLNYEFSLGSPVPGVVGEDNWSARWRGRFAFDAGDYRFLARGNDGVRVYINGIRVLNAWPNATDTVSNVFYGVGAGEHEITVEMYDAGGLAWVRAWWERLADTGASER